MVVRYEEYRKQFARKEVSEEIELSVNTSSIDDLITSLQLLKDQYNDPKYSFYVYGDYDGCVVFSVSHRRLETEEEFDTRVKKLYDRRVAEGRLQFEKQEAKRLKREHYKKKALEMNGF